MYNQSKNIQSIDIKDHLYQLYPNLPKYANDPQQSPIIRTYDLILKRYQGIYGHQPTYFIRSPLSIVLLGVQPSLSNVQSPTSNFNMENKLVGCNQGCISLNLQQNYIIAISKNNSSNGKIRINHYQSAVYGQKNFELDSSQWKYDKTDEYTTLLVATLKNVAIIYSLMNLPPMDIIIYSDFTEDQYVHWKQAMCLGLYTALHVILIKDTPLQNQMCIRFLKKVSSIRQQMSISDLSLINKFGNVYYHGKKYIKFPLQFQMIIAHSMTPKPKMMTQGKRHNLRICQLMIGIQIIKNQYGIQSSSVKSLEDLKKAVGANSISEFRSLVEDCLPKQGLNSQMIIQLSSKSPMQILKQVPYVNNVIDENLSFKAYDRIMFYLKQLQLIEKLSGLNESSQNYSQDFCRIIRESSQNAGNSLQIGSQQIDEMLKIISSISECYKIIGNSWGGYLLIICQKKNSRILYDQLIKQFYMAPKNQILLSDQVEQYIKIVEKPSMGLAILNPQSEIWY